MCESNHTFSHKITTSVIRQANYISFQTITFYNRKTSWNRRNVLLLPYHRIMLMGHGLTSWHLSGWNLGIR